MNYKLAEKLKDAGFPQKDPNEIIGFNLKKKDGWVEGKMKDLKKVYIPTLSKLIEECGEVNLSVAINGYSVATQPDSNKEYRGEGKTSKIAVAELFLARNKRITT